MSYVPNLVSIFVSSMYFTITHEVEDAVCCVLHMYTKMLGLYAHIAYLSCELYLEYGSRICSVIYIKYVYSDPFGMVDVSGFICGIGMYMHYICIHVQYLANMTKLVDIFVSGM